jgi:hypothetical protein
MMRDAFDPSDCSPLPDLQPAAHECNACCITANRNCDILSQVAAMEYYLSTAKKYVIYQDQVSQFLINLHKRSFLTVCETTKIVLI